MEQVVLVRYGEIILKGLNRSSFEKKLIGNIKNSLHGENIKILHSQARIYIEARNSSVDFDIDSIISKLKKVFGIVSVSPAYKVSADMESIYIASKKCISDVGNIETFKVEAKRGNKNFELSSPEICREVGGYILDNFDNLKVDVHNPKVQLMVEVRDFAYVYTDVIMCQGGMPMGTNGKAMVLLSGGIDSPVASFQIARRGVEISAIHFASPPYTGPKAKEKVKKLAEIVGEYAGKIKLYVVPFTDIQLELKDKCPYNQITILMRRFMMRIAERIAKIDGCQALITGENIGQVASQTMWSLVVTDKVVDMPIFRPLIGLDKNEIIEIARDIDTYDTSILPYEDCCTVFLPDRPETKPRLNKIEESEKHLDIEGLIEKAVNNVEIILVGGADNGVE